MLVRQKICLMSYKVLSIPPFDKQLKRLAKKYPSLRKEFSFLISSLESEPNQGTPIGYNCFKIRFAIESKGKGKSGRARVITYLQVTSTSIYLHSIYDKSEKENISNIELRNLLSLIRQEARLQLNRIPFPSPKIQVLLPSLFCY